MIFSNTAVSSLLSLLVVAMAASTTSGVGGAMTTNRKLSKRSLHHPQRSVRPQRCIIKWQSIIHLDRDTLCKHFRRRPRWTRTLYLDRDLTNKAVTLALLGKAVNINDDGEEASVITGSIVYNGTNTELSFGGYFLEEEFKPKATQDMAVPGGTRECALNFRTNDFIIEPEATYGTVEFHIMDITMMNH